MQQASQRWQGVRVTPVRTTPGRSRSSGIQAGVSAINEAGGVGGREIQTTTQDTEGKPQEALTGFETLLNENIVGMYGPFSNSMPAVLPSIEREQIPAFTSAGSTALDGKGGDYLYRPAGSDSDLGRARATFVRDQGWGRIATAGLDTSNSKSALGVLERSVETLDEVEVVESVELPTGASSYSSELSAIASADVDAVITTLGSEAAPLFIEDYRAEGIEVPLMLGNDSVGVQTVVDEVGADAMEGITGFTPGNAASYQQFSDIYTEYQDADSPPAYANVAYDGIIVFGLAAVAADTPDAAGIVDNISAVAGPDGMRVQTFSEGKELLEEGESINYDGASSGCDFVGGDAFPPLAVQEFTGGEWTELTVYEQADIAVSTDDIAE